MLTLLLAGLMTATLFGCGASDASDAQTGDSQTNDAATTDEAVSGDVPDAAGAILTLWMPPFGSEDTTDKDFWTSHLQEAADAMNATLAIETVPWDNYEEKYLTGITGGTGPDIGYMYNEMLRTYVDLGALQDVSSYFTEEEVADYIYWDLGNIEGTQYTVPFVVGAPRILYCNMDLLGEAGIYTPPTTWDELVATATAVNEATGKVGFQQYWGGYFGDLNEIFFPYLWQAGGEIYNEAGELVVNSEAGVEAATWLYSLKEQGILTESCTSLDGSAVGDAFKTGEVAMYVSSSTSAKKIDDAGINWDYTPYLSKTEGEQGYTCAVADCLVMFTSTQNKEAAAYLIKEMTKASTMEDFHKELYSMPPISVNEAYCDNEKLETMYTDYSDGFKTLPVVANASSVYSTLFSNLQLMMMGDLTPQQALDNTVTYAASMN